MKKFVSLAALTLAVVGVLANSAAAADTGYFEICKLADTSNGAVTGSFTYTWSGGSVSVPVGSCSPLQSAPAGSLTITETARAGFEVSGISASPAANLTSKDLTAGKATLNLTAGDQSTQTIVTYTNRVQPAPTPTGFLEVCKDAGAGVSGSFTFSVNGGAAFSVPAGSCSPLMQVAAGTATVTEAAASGYAIDHVYTQPADRFVGLTGNTATVKVVAGDASSQTVVHFVNKATTGQIKICKAADNTNGTVSGSFTFNLSPAAGSTSSVTVPVGACSQPLTYNVGTAVTVTEVAQSGIVVKSIALVPGTAPSSTLTSSSTSNGTAVVSIGSGTSDLTFTNTKPPAAPPPGTVSACQVSKGYIKTHADAVTAVSVGAFSLTVAQAQAILDVRGNATTGIDFNLANLYQQALASYYNVQVALAAGASANDPLLKQIIAAYTAVFTNVVYNSQTGTFSLKVGSTLTTSDLAALEATLSDFSQDRCRTFLKA
jgi:hypothetical protein